MFKNYFYNLLLTITNLLFPVLSFPYVSRVLGPEGIGKVQFVFSFAQYFALVASLGIPVYGMKEIARHKNSLEGRSKVFSELIFIYLISTCCIFTLYLAVIYSFPYFSADRNMYLSASLLVLLGFSYIDWLYTGMEEFKSIALRSVLFKLIGLVLLYLFIHERTDFRHYLYIMMFSFLGNNVLSLFLIRGRIKLVTSGLNLSVHLSPLLFILGTSLAASMYTDMDTVLLGFLSSDKTVGLYTAAVKLSKIAIPFVTSMGVILVPKIAQYFAEKKIAEVQLTLNQTFRFLAFFSVPIAFGLALLAPEFLALFSGRDFISAAASMQILAVLPMIIGFGHLFLYLVLIPAGRNREMFLCVLGGLLVSLILNVLLIPSYREIGSSVANICSEVVVSGLYLYFIRKHFRFSYPWSLLLKAAISSLPFLPLIWFIRGLSVALPYMLLLSIGGSGILYVLFQSVMFRSDFVLEMVALMKMKLSRGERR